MILSSTRLSGPAGAVTDFQRGAIAVPVLLVQHKEDSCPFSLYDAVERAKAFYQGAAPKVDLITVTGGEGKVTIKMRCKNGFHGFRGAERDTAEAIATWLLGKEFPSQVDAGRR